MNNNIWGKLPLHIMKNTYMGLTGSTMVKGILVDQRDAFITIDLGNQRWLEAQLRGSLKAEIGEQVTIDRRELIGVQIVDAPPETQLEKEEPVSRICKVLDLPFKEEVMDGLKALESHGVALSKESVMTYLKAKEYVERIIADLDYDKAIQLINKNQDIEGDSLQNVVRALEEVRGEKSPSFLWRFLRGRKELTTGEAEKICYKLYGNTMGKDTHDIIKALHRAGMEITKQSINQVDDIFRKVDALQNLEDKTLIQFIKSSIEPSIEHLYKFKNGFAKNPLKGEEKISPLAARAYEGMNYRPQKVTEMDLQRMEEDIKALLVKEGLEWKDDLLGLAKNLIRNGVEVSKENITGIQEIKEALGELKYSLDYEKTVALLQSGVKVEKENVVALSKMLKELTYVQPVDPNHPQGEKIRDFITLFAKLDKIDEKSLIQLMKSSRELKLETLMHFLAREGAEEALILRQGAYVQMDGSLSSHIRVIQAFSRLRNIDFDTIAFQINNRLPMTLEGLSHSYDHIHRKEKDGLMKEPLAHQGESLKELKNISREAEKTIEGYIQDKQGLLGLKGLKKDFEVVKALIKNSMVINRENITQLYQANRHIEQIKGHMTINTLLQARDQGLLLEKMELDQLVQYIGKTSPLFSPGLERLRILEALGRIREKTLAFQLANHLPLTIEGLELSQRFLDREIGAEGLKASLSSKVWGLLEEERGENFKFELDGMLKQGMNDPMAEKIEGIKRQIEQIEDYLKESAVAKSMTEGVALEKMELKSLLEYLRKAGREEERGEKVSQEGLERMKAMTDNLGNLAQHRESVISLLLKNAMPMTLKEVHSMSIFLKNQDQISTQCHEIAKILVGHSREEVREVGMKIKKLLEKISNQIKSGKIQTPNPYEEVGKLLKEVETKAGLLEGDIREALQKTGRKLLDSLELQANLNKEDTVFQLPVMMHNQLQNLQIYIMNHKKGGKKIDPNNMSVLLNFNTRNMGNLNIYLGITGKKVLMKMGVEREEDRRLFEEQIRQLEGLLDALGYTLKEMSFRVEEHQHIMTLREEVQGKSGIKTNYVDIRI